MHEDAIENHISKDIKIIHLNTNKTVDKEVTENRQIKLIDLINRKRAEKKRFFSIEVSPLKQLYLDYNEFATIPLFTAVTWLADVNLPTAENEYRTPPSFELARIVSRSTPILVHLSCYKLSTEMLTQLINENDICNNILALRGEYIAADQPMKYAKHLVETIKSTCDNKSVCIAVGGYPEMHPDAESIDADLYHLKEKVDAGASFIITQACISAEQIIDYVRACRRIGIQIPILPGIFVPASYKSLLRMCEVCKINVPNDVLEQFRQYQNDEIKFQQFSVDYIVNLVQTLFRMESELMVSGVHFFTLNQFELIKRVVDRLAFDAKENGFCRIF